MAYYDNYYTEYQQIETPLMMPATAAAPEGSVLNQRMMLILLLVVGMVLTFWTVKPQYVAGSGEAAVGAAGAGEVVVSETAAAGSDLAGESGGGVAGTGAGRILPGSGGQLSPVFTREVQHWAPQIVAWSAEYGVDPNLTAIIMQIESCGYQEAVSHAGAQGLFQVMPFHFAAGESSLDPATNARRGLNYFVERLNQTGGDVGRAFAGYNGGHGAAASSWDSWPSETQRYYKWSTGIYNDIKSGLTESPTLQSWLQAGGASLCQQAATRIGLQ